MDGFDTAVRPVDSDEDAASFQDGARRAVATRDADVDSPESRGAVSEAQPLRFGGD
uniref:hypothetical protein n=1 Tax=unclassified Rhodococcus (in: high G+C Gram-positive bacteria) TaxID=192944 RepID=UPI0015961E17|nr:MULTISPECIES: hypothetical protein [unclassified Rhodococcus (in: high G+C Gram-positive bacteria)]